MKYYNDYGVETPIDTVVDYIQIDAYENKSDVIETLEERFPTYKWVKPREQDLIGQGSQIWLRLNSEDEIRDVTAEFYTFFNLGQTAGIKIGCNTMREIYEGGKTNAV